jgi:hypothetical protein
MKILPKVAAMAAVIAAMASAQYCIPPSTAANCANGDEYLSNVTFGAVSVTRSVPGSGHVVSELQLHRHGSLAGRGHRSRHQPLGDLHGVQLLVVGSRPLLPRR